VKESADVKALRLEIESKQINLESETARISEFQDICEAVGRSTQLASLIADLAIDALANENTAFVPIITAVATGIQIGIDVQRSRNTTDTHVHKTQKGNSQDA
jgi:uncharacterized transporter YbjL